MTPDLKIVHCADIEDLPSWSPDDDQVCFWLQLSVGLPGSDAADIFQVCVATSAGLRSGGWRTIGRDERFSLLDSDDLTFLWSGPTKNPLPGGAA